MTGAPIEVLTLDAARAEGVLRDALSVTGEGRLVVTGTCMEPALSANAPVALRSAARPRVGDIVLFRGADGLRLHRVVWRSRGSLRTKGDRGRALDAPVPESAVIAVADPREGRLLALARAAVSIARVAFASRAPERRTSQSASGAG
jgi:hypothetical protein